MERITSETRPLPVMGVHGSPAKAVNFDIKEEADGTFSYYNVKVPLARWDYDHIVDAIITAEYPNDRMQAIINNYLLAKREEGEDAIEEFLQMQEWRALAKATAHEVLGE